MAILQAFQVGVSMYGFLMFGGSTEPTEASQYLPGVMLTLVMVAIGVSIVAYAEPIGGRLFPEGNSAAVSIGADELQVVLFSAVGALLLSESVPRALGDVVGLVAMSNQGLVPVGGGLWGQNGVELAEELLKTVLGVLLLVRGRNAAALLRRLRQLGTES